VLARAGDLAGAEDALATAAKAEEWAEEVAIALAEVRQRREEHKAAADGLGDFVTSHSAALAARTLCVACLRDARQVDKAILQARETAASRACSSSKPGVRGKEGRAQATLRPSMGKRTPSVHRHCTRNQGGSIAWYLRNTNVHWFRLELDDIKEMPFGDEECAEYELRTGELMVCEGGHGVGRTAVWMGELKPMMFQKALHRLRPRASMNSSFLAYQLKVAGA
jgi:hypothetical protein